MGKHPKPESPGHQDKVDGAGEDRVEASESSRSMNEERPNQGCERLNSGTDGAAASPDWCTEGQEVEVEEHPTNEEVGVLIERAHNAGDHRATEVLNQYFLTKIEGKAKVFPRHEREDVIQILLTRAWKVARVTLQKAVEKPRNYVVRSIGNAFVDYVRKRKRSAKEIPAAWDDAGSLEAPSGEPEDLQDVINRAALEGLHGYCKTPTQLKVVQVIELVYTLRISETEACHLLDFSPREVEAVKKALQRWRRNPSSPLHDFREDDERW